MKWSLATKIFLGFSLVLGVFGAVSIYGVTQLNAVRDQLNLVNRGLLPLNRIVAQMETLQESVRKSTESILSFDNLHRQKSLLDNSRLSFSRNMLARIQQARTSTQRMDNQRLQDIDRHFLEDVRRRLEQIGKQTNKFDSTLKDVIDSIDVEVGLPAEQDLIGSHNRNARLLARDVRLLERSLKNMITTKMLMMERDDSTATGVILWLSIIAVAVGVIVTVLSLLALRPIRRLAEGARRISRGDFSATVEVSTRDEFGSLATEFNRMARSLAHREEELVRQQQKLEKVNRELRQSGIDLELMKLYNENIIRSIQNGILVADPLGAITTLNPTAERLWGLNPDKTIGRKLAELPIAQTLSQLTTDWEKVLRERERMLFEAMEFSVPFGNDSDKEKTVLVDLYVSPLTGHDENVQGVLLVGEDVTEKVRTKQALLQSERLATIGRMSALVAHEIRNPLSSIGLNAELLEEEIAEHIDTATTEPKDLLKSISREVERLTEVTEEYLKFAKLPKPQLIPEKLDVILHDLLHFVESEFRGAKIELHDNLDIAGTVVRADEGQLRQAFLNLLRNSMESMPEGGTLTIASQRTNGAVQVQIADTGQGIESACLDRIFDPFFSTRESGTGLGLSLTQQIVSEHGGTISCQSEPGQGTSFVVELPSLHNDMETGELKS
jgi:PAS domain S-box-containing protein